MVAPTESMYPNLVSAGASGSVLERGLVFTPTVAGTVTAFRRWRQSGTVATAHVFRLWNATTQAQLTTVTSSAESGAGWYSVNLPTPYPLVAGQSYVVSWSTVDLSSSGIVLPQPDQAPHLTVVEARYANTTGTFPSLVTTNYSLIDVVFQPTFGVVLTPATTPHQPVVVTINGASAGQVLTLVRERSNGVQARLPGTVIANASGDVALNDWLYPVDGLFRYLVYDSLGTTLLLTSAYTSVPSGGFPWITDTVYSEAGNVAVRIVDFPSKTYPGRVTPYTVVGTKYPVTVGDVRSGAQGSMRLLTLDHAERDLLLRALSFGTPCRLRVPAACAGVVDEMYFAPEDITETSVGTGTMSIMDVDFLEVAAADAAAFQAATYATQTANADAAGMTYAGLTTAFVGKTYRELYLSPTGIAP